MFLLNRVLKKLALLSGWLTLGAMVVLGDASGSRRNIPLLEDWKTIAMEAGSVAPQGIHQPDFNDQHWQRVNIPHNWDGYEGFRQARHGNFHGTAWYRRTFSLTPQDQGRQIFLFFEGVGSYATIWVNGTMAGTHAGGLTTFTLDVTHLIVAGDNVLVVQADHPPSIRDLPWVCGGCELAYGFSEGTQPFGISRPVTLVITDSLRIEPFGVHVWNDQDISAAAADLHLHSEIRNYGSKARRFILRTSVIDPSGTTLFSLSEGRTIEPGQRLQIPQTTPLIDQPQLWSPDDPKQHRIVSELFVDGTCVDRVVTDYGIRWIEWPDLTGPTDQPLLINGAPFFINGVADYEHMLGQSHAFSEAAILARARQIKAAGFNAFRDAHHPHNLRFNAFWDTEGLLWWTQFGAHIWFENEAFAVNYKSLLRDWIRERRNSPSLILYGLQNESKLPLWFVEECVAIIRELDPTASTQRLVTTCNGGGGTDWDVPQNWSGTYGGDPNSYDKELRSQRLVGEYGAWRSLDLHSEGGYIEDGPLSEDRMTALMETKVRLAESVRDKVVGHFMWPFLTHQNPGRNVGAQGQQTQDGIRVLDRIGPANNKGLLSIWGEPLDAYYMYRSNYADPQTDPMVYIASHTWPDRWTSPGPKDGILVYSNCEEVELFNDRGERSLGMRSRKGIGTHFRWDNVPIEWNILYAEGRINGSVVATDIIQLNHLPPAPAHAAQNLRETATTKALEGQHYLFRVNAGGPDYLDTHGQLWEGDRLYREGSAWGSLSWDLHYENLPAFFGSKRRIHDPVQGTADDTLFQSFRYGRDQLRFLFEVPNGRYTVELFFVEPWYGTGGGLDCTGWRIFDVAINGKTALDDLDIWKEVGRAKALRKIVPCTVQNGKLEISFPEVRAGQAVISAIAISASDAIPLPEQSPPHLIRHLRAADNLHVAHRTWLDTGDLLSTTGNDTFSWIPWDLREAEWIQLPEHLDAIGQDPLVEFTAARDATVYIAHPPSHDIPHWLQSWTISSQQLETKQHRAPAWSLHFRHFTRGERIQLGQPKLPGARLYTVIVTERRAPPPATGIVEFSTAHSMGSGWQPAGHLKSGLGLYVDDSAPLAEFSSRFSDADWIRTDPLDATDGRISAKFRHESHVEVFALFDPSIDQLPDWTTGWVPSDWHLTTDKPDATRYQGVWKRFAPSEWIELGPNGSSSVNSTPAMYSVVIRSVKPDRLYELEASPELASLVRSEHPDFTGTGYLDLRELDKPRLAFAIEVGVGDRYTLIIRHKNLHQPLRDIRLSIIASDGTQLCEDRITLAESRGSGWESLRYRTCDSINAGTYRVLLEGEALHHLLIDSVTVE